MEAATPNQTPVPAGLHLVPSPLGNLGDVSLRMIDLLRQAHLVAAEDTRRTLKLLSRLGLRTPMISYREENHRQAWPRLAEALGRGEIVALLTDAGAPGVSDPGAMLVKSARAAGFAVHALPGPSAVVTALMASGFSADRFTFAGFLPAKSGERRAAIQSLATVAHTLVFFEAPHRLEKSLADLAEILGPRQALLAREMTKLHEEFVQAPLSDLLKDVRENPRKGEITLVVEGAGDAPAPAALDEGAVRRLAAADPRPTKALAAALAAETGQPKALLYRLILEGRKG